MSAEETRQALVMTLVSDVTTAYVSLRERDYVLEIAEHTLTSREASLALIQSRRSGGVSTLLDQREAEQLVYAAAQTIPTIRKDIEQLREDPREIPRGRSLTEQSFVPAVPPGLPFAVLQRRPDIRAAEQDLIGADAEIGVARAANFQQLTLSGVLGRASTSLTSLFSASSSTWNLAPR